MMELHEFRDTLKKLSFIDRQPWMADAEWETFRDDPVRSFVKSDDETATRLWSLIAPGESARDTVIDAARRVITEANESLAPLPVRVFFPAVKLQQAIAAMDAAEQADGHRPVGDIIAPIVARATP